jgi:hypothetical protein
MKSDRREKAAWRTFGLLSPKEQVAFDSAAESDPALAAARNDMETLAAAISVNHSRPVTPESDSLAIIQDRCGLSGRRRLLISRMRLRPALLAWAGWGVAAALVVLLAVREKSGTLTAGESRTPDTDTTPGLQQRPENRSNRSAVIPNGSVARAVAPNKNASSSMVHPVAVRNEQVPGSVDPSLDPGLVHLPGTETGIRPSEFGEKRRLIQEIETLRAELARSKQQTKELLTPAPGRSWPLIVEMKSPTASRDESDPPLTSQIADALAGKVPAVADPASTAGTASATAVAEQPQPAEGASQTAPASAVPVYDPARDSGTLAVRNLQPAPSGSQYNLWVNTADSSEPVFVGTLPDNLQPTDSLDFNLGSTGIVPSTYYLTVDSVDMSKVGHVKVFKGPVVTRKPATPPNPNNIILQGP